MLQTSQIWLLDTICRLPAKRFVSIFNTINTLTRRYAITTSVGASSDNQKPFIIVKDAEDEIIISQPGRLRLYRNGIAARLDVLFTNYLLKEIPFTTDDIIVDCGANIGELTKVLQQKYNVKAMCVEPETRDSEAIRRNTNTQDTNVYETLLWKENTTLNFFQNNKTGDSSVFDTGTNETPISKSAVTLEKLVSEDSFYKQKKRIKLLKIEAEGVEPEVLKGALPILSTVEYITVDCGPEKIVNGKRETTAIDVLSILASAGFSPIKFNHKRIIFLFKNQAYL
jgi:FkbM family methyltransferase